jgi:hypothetical protein
MLRKWTRERDGRSVPKARGLKIGHHLLAVVLFGALAMQSSRAEEAASGAHETGAATAPAKASGSPQGSGGNAAGSAANPANHAPADAGAGSKGEIGAGPQAERGARTGRKGDGGADVKGATVHGAHAGARDGGAAVNPIDTRISVQSRRPTKRPDKIGDVKIVVRPGALVNFRARHHTSAPGAIGGIAKDAIGLPMANRGVTQGPNAVAHQGPPSAAQISVGTAGGIARNAAGSLANAGAGGPQVAPRGAGPIGTATATNHAAINGTGLTRPGYGPGTVGGPAKAVAGINGTSVRPKH